MQEQTDSLNSDRFIDRPARETQNSLRWLLLIVAVLSIRIITAVLFSSSLEQDPDAYVALAKGWSATGTFCRDDLPTQPTAYRPPLYPWLLSWFVFQGKLILPLVLCVHILLGSLTCVLTARITNRLLHFQKLSIASIVAALAVAVDPILVRQSSLIMTETAATFLAMSTWWVWLQYHPLSVTNQDNTNRSSIPKWSLPIIIGGMLGISSLLRPTTLAWAAFIALFHILPQGKRLKKASQSCLMMISVFLVLLPWAFRNQQQLGSMIWTTTHGGYTLLLANNEVLYNHFKTENLSRTWDENRFHWLWDRRRTADPLEENFWNTTTDAQPAEIASDQSNTTRSEVEDDRLASQAAIATIKRSPRTFLISCMARFGWFFAIAPGKNQASLPVNALIGSWYIFALGMFLWALAGSLVRLLKRPTQVETIVHFQYWIPAIALVTSLVLIHTVYWSNMRMRAPIMPVIYIAITLLWFRRSPLYLSNPRLASRN